MQKYHIPKELGGWITTFLTFLLSLGYYLIYDKLIFMLIIFWLPVFFGLMLFDSKIKNLNKFEVLLLVFALIFGSISIIENICMIIPYLFYIISYFLRQKKIDNAFITFFGLIGQSTMFYFSLNFIHYHLVYLSFLLFIYLYGAEFGIKSLIRKNLLYSFYNFIPFLAGLLLGLPIFVIALTRISYVYIKKIKIIGIMETAFYIVIIIFIFKIPLFHLV